MSRLVEGLARSGQHNNLMSILLEQNWESTTTAGIQMETLKESGATPLIQISDGTIALFPHVLTLRSNKDQSVLRPISSLLSGHPEVEGRANQRWGERLSREIKTDDNKDQSVLRAIMSVKKEIHLVSTILER